MLRSDEILALDEVTEACQLAVDHFEEFAEAVDDSGLAEMFIELAVLHREQVAKLDYQVEKLGELPKRPDPDREAFEQLVNWLRAEFGENRRRALLDKAMEIEERVIDKIELAEKQNLPEEISFLLKTVRGAVVESVNRIGAVKKT